jgi:hypothetical protein
MVAPHNAVTLFQILDIEGSLFCRIKPAGGRYHPGCKKNLNCR